MEQFHFASNKFAKGRLTIESSGEYRDFSLNPTELRDTKSFVASSSAVAGVSHPIEQDGSGSERLISFTLRFDGDVGYRDRRRADPNILAGDALVTPAPSSFNVMDEIAWYRQFIYTEGNARLGVPGSVRPIVLFSFGPMYPGLRCKVRAAPYRVFQFDKNLRPTRAEMDLVLVEQVQFSVSRSQVWSPSTNRGF